MRAVVQFLGGRPVKPAVPAKPGIAGCFTELHTTEEGLHRTVKAFKSLLARSRVCLSKIRVSLPVLSETLTLLSKPHCTLLSFVNVFSFCKSIIVQMTVRVQQGNHSFFLLLRWIRSVLKRLLHRALIDTPPVSLNPEHQKQEEGKRDNWAMRGTGALRTMPPSTPGAE